MKITESKLRKMIRGVIREFTSTATAAGAKPGGYESQATKDAKAAVNPSRKFRKPDGRGGYTYSSTGGFGWGTNPDYTSQVSARDTAETAKDSALTTRDTAREADLQAEVPTQEPPSGGGAGGFGKGKAAGKDKKKKN